MAANLTPQYHKAERAYRRAASAAEQLACLQDMLRELPKHKASEKIQSELKQKISRAKQEVENERKTGKRANAVRIAPQGAGTVAILGGPNAGKSQLLASLTRATPEIAPYPFTTRAPLPGMMDFEGVPIQLIDTPPITADYLEPYMQDLIRGVDVAVLIVDLAADEGIEHVQQVLDKLNSTRTRLANRTYLDETDVGLSYTRTLLVPNKLDAAGAADRLEFLHEWRRPDFPEYPVSAVVGTGLAALREAIFRALGVIRIHTKLPAEQEPDRSRPLILRSGGTVLELAELIHEELAAKLAFARVWSHGEQEAAQVKGDHVLQDQDVVELHV
jgi:hypothetical protein